jgi:hypothetical protein
LANVRAGSGLVAAMALAASGCAALGASESARPTAPELPAAQARCKVAAGQENPLVTEWASAEKVALEAHAKTGAVAVEWSGCALRILPECRAPGTYRWRRTTTTTDFVELRDADELYAKLPLGAATLEPELERAGRLAIQTTVSGQLELDGFDAARTERDPRCAAATHVVRGVAVGAFGLSIGSGPPVRGAGNADVCKLATEDEPHPDCRSPVQVFLAPLPRTLARRGPPGTLRVRFLPPDPDRAWRLSVAERKLCDVPCTRSVDPALPYSFRADGGFLRGDDVVDIPDLRPFDGAGDVEVRPVPRNTGRLVWGIVMTSIGGLGMITGGVLLASGCGGQDQGRCIAGAIATPAGALLVAPGIWFIVTSRGGIEVAPATLPVGQNMDGESVLR